MSACRFVHYCSTVCHCSVLFFLHCTNMLFTAYSASHLFLLPCSHIFSNFSLTLYWTFPTLFYSCSHSRSLMWVLGQIWSSAVLTAVYCHQLLLKHLAGGYCFTVRYCSVLFLQHLHCINLRFTTCSASHLFLLPWSHMHICPLNFGTFAQTLYWTFASKFHSCSHFISLLWALSTLDFGKF